MTDIDVTERGGAYHVTVRDGSSETKHEVGIPGDYMTRLGLAHVDGAALVVESFYFLLEREPKESIMRSFELSIIERYFPEYPDEIKRRLAT
jgi:hypothetical protein